VGKFQIAETNHIRGLGQGGERGGDAESCQQGKTNRVVHVKSPLVFYWAAVRIPVDLIAGDVPARKIQSTV
jgi:hypothetical protein